MMRQGGTVVGAEDFDPDRLDFGKTGEGGRKRLYDLGGDIPGGKTLFFVCSCMTNRLS